MRVAFDSDEYYPFWTVEVTDEERPGWKTMEVTPAWMTRYERIMADFKQLQTELAIMAARR